MLDIFWYILLALLGIFVSRAVIAMGGAIVIAVDNMGVKILGGLLIFVGWSGTVLFPIYYGLKIIIVIVTLVNNATVL